MPEWTTAQAKAFGEALIRQRDKRSQQWVADQLTQRGGQVSRALVQQWEAGATEPPRAMVFELDRLFGLRAGSFSRILGYLPAHARPAKTVVEAIDSDPALTAVGRRFLLRVYEEAAGL